MPVDCIKTFYQEHKSNKKNLSFWKISKYGLKKYGINGLYNGWNARFVQYTINSMFTLVLF